MSKFILNQKFLSITEKFEIKDENQQTAYFVDGKFFSIGKQFNLTGKSGEDLAEIKQKLISFRPTFFITFKNGTRAKVMKMFTPIFKSRFLLQFDNREITIMGNFLSHEYQFTENNETVASVSKKWFSFTDSYGLDVEDDSFGELALCSLIIIDTIHHGQDSNN